VSAPLPRERGRGGPRWAAGGALAAAVAYVLTLACCVPVALGVAGAAVAGLSGFLAPYQPYLAGVALLLLGVAFYRAYRRPGRCAGECAPAARPPLALWLLAAAVLVLLTAPFWMPGRG
jgi:mercuric ion transport protein